MRFRHFAPLHRDGNNAGGGGTGTAARPARRPASPYRDEGQRRPTNVVDNLIAKYGTAEAALQAIGRENADAAEREEDLRRQVQELSAKVAPDGAVILTGDDAKAWPAFKAINLAPDALAAAVTERDALKATVAERDRAELRRTGAELSSFKPAVWDLTKTKDLHLEIRDTQVQKPDGTTETKRVPHVRPADKADAPLEPLDAYVKREVPDLYDALRVTANGGTAGAGAGNPAPLVPFAGAPASGGSGPADPVAAMLAEKDAARAKGNAIMPAQKTA